MEPHGLKPTDLAYLAGYVDADGCVRYTTTPRIEVTSVFPFVLNKFVKNFGGSMRIRSKKDQNDRHIYRWSASGKNALRAMADLRDHMFEKQAQVDLIFRIRATSPGPERLGLQAQLRALKHHNYETPNQTEVNQ